MNFDKFLTFVSKHIDFFSSEDIKLIIGGKYSTLFSSLNQRYLEEQDEKIKSKLEDIVYFLSNFIEDYKNSAYKYDYTKSNDFEHYKYWFDFYMKSKLLTQADKTLNDIKVKFPDDSRSLSLEKKLLSYKNKYLDEFNNTKKIIDRNNKLRNIELMIGQGEYSQAMIEALKFLQEYPDDKDIKKYLDKIDELKAKNITETVAISKTFFEKVGLLHIASRNELKKSDLSDIYKKLSGLLKMKDYEGGLSLIKYIKDKFKIDDPKLLSYHNKFIDLQNSIQQNKQKDEYNLELKSLKMLVKNKHYEDGLLKANSILKKYPLISKKEVLNIIKQIKDDRHQLLKQKGKTGIDKYLENLLMRFSSLSKRSLYQFYQKMAWFLNAKMDLKMTLQVIFYQSKDPGLKKFLRDILDGIDSGMKLSEIVKWYSQISRLDISLIRIGESTGKLGDMFANIYQNYKEDDERKKKIKSVMIYPAIVIIVTLAIFVMLLVFIIPKFIELFNQMNVPLPWITQKVIMLSDFVRNQWYLAISMIFASIVGYKLFSITKIGKYAIGWCTLRLPVMNQIVYKKYVIYFSGYLSLLLKSGINLLDAIDLLVYGTQNPWYQDEFKRIRFELETGVTFSKAVGLGKMEDIGNYTNIYIPIDLAYAIDIGERTGQLGDLLGEVAIRYDEDLKMIIKNLQSLMEPMIILLVGAVVFTFVLSVFLPMIQMYNVIGKMGGM